MPNLRVSLLASTLGLSSLAGCAPGDLAAPSVEEAGQLEFAIKTVPADVRCVQLAFDSAGRNTTRAFDASPGASLTARLTDLPLGTGQLGATAFNAPCASVTPTTAATWRSDAANVTVSTTPAKVTLTMRSSGVVDVELDFDTGSGCASPDPAACDKSVVGRWTFDEPSGATVNDVGPQKQNGTIVVGASIDARPAASPQRVPGKSGTALAGGMQWVRVPDSNVIDAVGDTGTITVAAWVNLSRLPNGKAHVASRAEVGTEFVHFDLGVKDGFPMAQVHFSTAVATTPLRTNGWVHLATTYDAITARLYVDGKEVGSLDIGWPLSADTTPIVIGGRQGLAGVSELFPGALDDVRIWSRVLTSQEIAAVAK